MGKCINFNFHYAFIIFIDRLFNRFLDLRFVLFFQTRSLIPDTVAFRGHITCQIAKQTLLIDRLMMSSFSVSLRLSKHSRNLSLIRYQYIICPIYFTYLFFESHPILYIHEYFFKGKARFTLHERSRTR